jgi:hypothetical protein
MQWLKDRKIHNGPFSLFFVIPAFYASLSHRLEPASSLNKGQMGQALPTIFASSLCDCSLFTADANALT